MSTEFGANPTDATRGERDIWEPNEGSGESEACQRTQPPSTHLQARMAEAEKIVRDIFDRFPPTEIGVAFNGGKDSVVMFELLRKTIAAEVLVQCCIFVVEIEDEFDELRDFRTWYMQEVARGLPLVHQTVSGDMRLSLWKLMETNLLKAVFMGTRQTDPHGRYQHSAVEKTSAGWPDFLRVCPLFHWTAEDIWAYTRCAGVPQCPLYAVGYTSLGKTTNTNRNPLLRQRDGSYSAAWELTGTDDERLGRGSTEGATRE